MLGKLFKRNAPKDLSKVLAEAIDSMEREPIAKSTDHRLFLSTYELGGYHYMHFDLVGPTKVRTAAGGGLTLLAEHGQIDLETDSEEIETDFNSKLGIGVTGFDIDKDEIVEAFLAKGPLQAISIRLHNKEVRFEGIDQEQLRLGQIIPPPVDVSKADDDVIFEEVFGPDGQSGGEEE